MPPKHRPTHSVEEEEKIYLSKRLTLFHESDDACSFDDNVIMYEVRQRLIIVITPSSLLRLVDYNSSSSNVMKFVLISM
jgi:hypothetical protein